MREFVYFSSSAVTTGNFDDLMDAGRMDIVSHVVVMSFFVSHAHRANVRLHLFLYGPPDPPKHLEIRSGPEGVEASISKKDVIGLIKRMLYKSDGDDRVEPFPNCFVDRDSLITWVEDRDDRNIHLLDERGGDLRETGIGDDPIFILGDHEGIPKKKHRRVKQTARPVSIGPVTYFSSQTVAIVHNELDRREIW